MLLGLLLGRPIGGEFGEKLCLGLLALLLELLELLLRREEPLGLRGISVEGKVLLLDGTQTEEVGNRFLDDDLLGPDFALAQLSGALSNPLLCLLDEGVQGAL